MPWRLLCRREALLARQRGNIDVVTTGTVDKPRLDFSSPRWRAFDDHAIFEVQLNPKNSVNAANTATPATMAKTARKKPGWEQSQPGLNFCDASVPRGDVRVAR